MKFDHEDLQRTSLEEFFFQPHPFTDLVLIVQGRRNWDREKKKKISSSACLDRQFYADKSVLAAASKVFQSYFQDDQLDSIEILDVTVNEMMDLLQFLYPQFPCTITNDNVTSLLILGKGHLFDVCEMTG